MTGRCFLYLMERTGLLKIGISEDPTDRAHTLTLQSGERVEVVHRVEYSTRDAARFAEARAHHRFAAHRTFGEWFTDTPEIREYVARLLPADDETVAATLSRIVDRKVCPKCSHTGPVGSDFGWREMGDRTIRSQSYCRDCRATGRAPQGGQLVLPVSAGEVEP